MDQFAAEPLSATPLTGKANFGFVSKYHKGATFQRAKRSSNSRPADLNFHSTSYDWLVIGGSQEPSTRVWEDQWQPGNYGFMLTAIDGQLWRWRHGQVPHEDLGQE